MENWVIFKDIRMIRSISRMKILRVTFNVRHVRPLTTSAVVLPGVAFTEMISSGSVLMIADSRKELQGESPAVDEPVRVDAREEASKVLIVYTWCRKVVEIGVFEELDEIKDISFCQVVGESLW